MWNSLINSLHPHGIDKIRQLIDIGSVNKNNYNEEKRWKYVKDSRKKPVNKVKWKSWLHSILFNFIVTENVSSTERGKKENKKGKKNQIGVIKEHKLLNHQIKDGMVE